MKLGHRRIAFVSTDNGPTTSPSWGTHQLDSSPPSECGPATLAVGSGRCAPRLRAGRLTGGTILPPYDSFIAASELLLMNRLPRLPDVAGSSGLDPFQHVTIRLANDSSKS